MALGTNEIIIIVVAVVFLFGAAAIPKIARSLGQAKGEFTRAKKEFDAGMSDGPSEDQIRRTARDLGIDDSKMTLDEVKEALNNRTSGPN